MNLEIATMVILAERHPLPSQEERDRQMAELKLDAERPRSRLVARTRRAFGAMLVRLGSWVLSQESSKQTATPR